MTGSTRLRHIIALSILLTNLSPTDVHAQLQTVRHDESAVVQLGALVEAVGDGPTEQSVVPQRGSGTVISPNGVILTNYHVIHPERLDQWVATQQGDLQRQGLNRTLSIVENRFAVLVSEGEEQPPIRRYTAERIEESPELDLAVLRIVADDLGKEVPNETLNLPFLPLGNSDNVRTGDALSIVGFPMMSSGRVVTAGSVSGFEGDEPAQISQRGWILTDATVSGGSSGGAAIDGEGWLVGITTLAGRLECRNDGQVDESDAGCVYIGGSLAKVRPINLAEPLLGPVYDYFDAAGVDLRYGTYLSPTYDWGIAWDKNAWQVKQAVTVDGYDALKLGEVVFSAMSSDLDPASCVESWAATIAGSTPLEGGDGTIGDGEQGGRAWGTYAVRRVAEDDLDGYPDDYVHYVECRTIEAGRALLVIFYFVRLDRYEQRLPAIQALLANVRIPGNAYTSPGWGYSLTWDPVVWRVIVQHSTRETDEFVLTGGQGALIFTARGGFDGNLEECVSRLAAAAPDVFGWVGVMRLGASSGARPGNWQRQEFEGAIENGPPIKGRFQCLELAANQAVLEITHFTLQPAYEREAQRVDDVLATIELSTTDH